MGTFIMTNFTPADMPNAKKAADAGKGASKKAKATPKAEEPKVEAAPVALETPAPAPEADYTGNE